MVSEPAMPVRLQTWLIIGASRGIGHEFATQLLGLGHRVLATARSPASASKLWSLTGTPNGGNLTILECDVTDEESVRRMTDRVRKLTEMGSLDVIDVCVINAGVLVYPNRATEISFKDFDFHLQTNTIGPIITAQSLLKLSPSLPIDTLVFISSDSGSAANFRAFEDGFAAYAASKAALNQGLRHMAAELHRKGSNTVVLALHPGEVATDMANITLEWEVEGIIAPDESVHKMLQVIESKGHGGAEEGGGEKGVASFWTWEGNKYPW